MGQPVKLSDELVNDARTIASPKVAPVCCAEPRRTALKRSAVSSIVNFSRSSTKRD